MSATVTIDGSDATLPSEVLIFLERLLEEAHAKPTNDELKKVMITELAGRLQQQVVLDLLNKLPQEKFDEFETLMTQHPEQNHITSFLKTSVPGSEEIVAQSLLDFKDVFLASTAE